MKNSITLAALLVPVLSAGIVLADNTSPIVIPSAPGATGAPTPSAGVPVVVPSSPGTQDVTIPPQPAPTAPATTPVIPGTPVVPAVVPQGMAIPQDVLQAYMNGYVQRREAAVQDARFRVEEARRKRHDAESIWHDRERHDAVFAAEEEFRRWNTQLDLLAANQVVLWNLAHPLVRCTYKINASMALLIECHWCYPPDERVIVSRGGWHRHDEVIVRHGAPYLLDDGAEFFADGINTAGFLNGSILPEGFFGEANRFWAFGTKTLSTDSGSSRTLEHRILIDMKAVHSEAVKQLRAQGRLLN